VYFEYGEFSHTIIGEYYDVTLPQHIITIIMSTAD